MAIKYEKGLLKVDQTVGQDLSQHLIEGDLIIPEGMPEIAGILDISAVVFGTGKEITQDKVMVEGIIRYNLLYRGIEDSNSISQIEDDIPFTEHLDIKGAGPKMIAHIDFELEHNDYEIMDNRLLKVKTVLNMDCKVQEIKEVEVIRGFHGDSPIEVLQEPIELVATEGYGSGQTIIREDVAIPDDMPSIRGILKKTVKPRIIEKVASDNRVIAHGEIDIKFLYQSDEDKDPMHLLEYTIPFSHFIEIQGAYQGVDVEAFVEVQEMDVVLRQDVVGDIRTLSIDMMLYMEGRILGSYDQDIITDAYSPGSKLNLIKEKVVLTRFLDEGQSQSIIRDNIEIGEHMPPISQILHIEARALVSDYRIEEGQLLIDGIILGTVLYKQEDETLPVNSLKVDIPYTQALELEGITEGMECDFESMVQYLSHTLISPREFEIKATMLIKGIAKENIEKEILLDIEEIAIDDKGISGIYVYFVQPGDTLWSIAKRYNTTTNSILKYNEVEDQDSLETGSRIIVFKKLDTSIAQ